MEMALEGILNLLDEHGLVEILCLRSGLYRKGGVYSHQVAWLDLQRLMTGDREKTAMFLVLSLVTF